MEYEDIILSKENGIATIRLNRPERMNALSPGMVNSLPLAIEEVRQDDDIRVLVLTGAGRGFCAGADLGRLEAGGSGHPIPFDYRGSPRSNFHRTFLALRGLEKPTIAMVNGAAVGGGCDLALTCDMRIAGESARFGQVYIKLGIVPANGGAYLLPRLVGLAKACELIFTGDIIGAREAEKIGLVNTVVSDDQLEAETMRLAQKIADGPPIAMRLAKTSIYECLSRDYASSLDYVSIAAAVAQSTEDHREGVRAQMERRQAVFKGR